MLEQTEQDAVLIFTRTKHRGATSSARSTSRGIT